jgi:hypothetical protein
MEPVRLDIVPMRSVTGKHFARARWTESGLDLEIRQSDATTLFFLGPSAKLSSIIFFGFIPPSPRLLLPSSHPLPLSLSLCTISPIAPVVSLAADNATQLLLISSL